MVIHRGRGWIYIAIPKTGSTSLTRMLQMPMFGGTYSGAQHDTKIPRGDFKLIFATVRNPYTRAVSMYAHYLNQGLGPDRVDEADYPFEKFGRDQLLGRANVDAFFWGTMSFWAGGIGKRDLKTLHLETIQAELTALGIHRGRFPVIRVNESRHRPWRAYYDATTEGIIREWASEDFERFGYSPDIGAAR